MKRILSYLFMLSVFLTAGAQATDVTTTAAILLKSGMEVKAVQSQLALQSILAGSYYVNKTHVDQTTAYIKEANDYLNTVQSWLTYIAQTYGLYKEAEELVKNVSYIVSEIGDSPTNTVAVALKPQINMIYADVVDLTVSLIMDVYTCFSAKATEKERLDLILNLRPKMTVMNSKLRRLGKYIHYTTLASVWDDIRDRHRRPSGNSARDALEKWQRRAGYIKVER